MGNAAPLPVTLSRENHGQTSLPMPPDPVFKNGWCCFAKVSHIGLSQKNQELILTFT
jgi:hypothetical protein